MAQERAYETEASAITDRVAEGGTRFREGLEARMPERASRMARNASERIQRIEDYMNEIDLREIGSRLRELVRRHPTEFLLSSVAAGFLAGCALRRR